MCEQLERELNVAKERIKNLESALCTVENIDNVNAYQDLESANKRIKRLEEAGNNLLWNFCPEYTSDLTQEQSDALKQWNKAKEAKP
jgi:hypothetical protein